MPAFKLCAVTSCLTHLGAEGAVRALAALGYSAVEFLATGTLMPEDAPTQRRQELRRLSQDVGITIAGLNGVLPATGFNVLVDDQVQRRRGIDQLKRVIDLCSDIGGHIVTVGSPGARNWPEGMPETVWFPRAVEAFKEWCPHAADQGVLVNLEIVNRFEVNWGRTIDEGLAFLGPVSHPNLGLTIDTFHMNIEEGPFAAAIARGGPAIRHVHVADSNRQAPGAGNLNFDLIISSLASINFGGFVSVELFPTWQGIALNEAPEDALRHARITLSDAMARVEKATALTVSDQPDR